MAAIETTNWVNRLTVEEAYRMARRLQAEDTPRSQNFARRGMRAAKARDPKLLLVLEKATEIVTQMSQEQFGQTRYRTDIPYSDRVEPTEVQLWREAYRLCDEGNPIGNFMWIYGAAAHLAFA